MVAPFADELASRRQNARRIGLRGSASSCAMSVVRCFLDIRF
jgi:hypothetical protein